MKVAKLISILWSWSVWFVPWFTFTQRWFSNMPPSRKPSHWLAGPRRRSPCLPFSPCSPSTAGGRWLEIHCAILVDISSKQMGHFGFTTLQLLFLVDWASILDLIDSEEASSLDSSMAILLDNIGVSFLSFSLECVILPFQFVGAGLNDFNGARQGNIWHIIL